MKKPVVLCILDGVGINPQHENNAYYLANTPTLDMLKSTYPTSTLKTSGLAVGLPEGQMGNSEVGHLNLGAGRVVYQSLTLINKAIVDGEFEKNEVLIDAIHSAKKNNKKLHIMGLLSDGGVHSHIDHLYAILKLAKKNNFFDVYVHAFLDGRDTARDSGLGFVKDLLAFMKENKIGYLASLSGRYYAMDRDKRFERNYKAYQAMVLQNSPSFDIAEDYISNSYRDEVYDEFLEPVYNCRVNGKIEDEDSVICINFRPDRSVQIASILTNPDYEQTFENLPKNLKFVSMMVYDQSVKGTIAFHNAELVNVLGPYLASKGLKQLRIAETEKFAHVTFFFDGTIRYDGINQPELENCKRILIPSPKVATYDLQPEMSAFILKDELIAELSKKDTDVVILNFANGDMVGHTGVVEAAVKAMEAVDKCLGEIYQVVSEQGGVMLITADHGNCEQMKNDKGQVLTSHTTFDVEIIYTDKDAKIESGSLCDIAPTILDILDIEQPAEMTGHSLIK